MEFPFFWSRRRRFKTGERHGLRAIRCDGLRQEIDFVLTVIVGVTTLCPCSKAISKYGAHNQRGNVTVQIRSRKAIWIEDLIAIVESSASSELYSLLKRQDEKAVTERAYENPVFVEDLVRNVALKLNAHPDVTWYKIEAENQESIHSHNAYACIERLSVRLDPEQTGVPGPDTPNIPDLLEGWRTNASQPRLAELFPHPDPLLGRRNSHREA
jgi:GTP cyclohydrolase I